MVDEEARAGIARLEASQEKMKSSFDLLAQGQQVQSSKLDKLIALTLAKTTGGNSGEK